VITVIRELPLPALCKCGQPNRPKQRTCLACHAKRQKASRHKAEAKQAALVNIYKMALQVTDQTMAYEPNAAMWRLREAVAVFEKLP
jgi:hypothetical protein